MTIWQWHWLGSEVEAGKRFTSSLTEFFDEGPNTFVNVDKPFLQNISNHNLGVEWAYAVSEEEITVYQCMEDGRYWRTALRIPTSLPATGQEVRVRIGTMEIEAYMINENSLSLIEPVRSVLDAPDDEKTLAHHQATLAHHRVYLGLGENEVSYIMAQQNLPPLPEEGTWAPSRAIHNLPSLPEEASRAIYNTLSQALLPLQEQRTPTIHYNGPNDLIVQATTFLEDNNLETSFENVERLCIELRVYVCGTLGNARTTIGLTPQETDEAMLEAIEQTSGILALAMQIESHITRQ